MKFSRVTPNGRITIPFEMRKKYKLTPGRRVKLEIADEGIKLIPLATAEEIQPKADGPMAEKTSIGFLFERKIVKVIDAGKEKRTGTMNRAFYSNTISEFLNTSDEEIIGVLALNNQFTLEQTQRDAWLEEIRILKTVLENYRNEGAIYLEFSIPRMGQRIDAVLLIGSVIFVLEFKVGEKEFTSYAIDQVMDYALDLKNFHETSHEQFIAPILIATNAKASYTTIELTPHNDKILHPIRCNTDLLSDVIKDVLISVMGKRLKKQFGKVGITNQHQLSLKLQEHCTLVIP